MSLTILCPNGRRQTMKVNPNTSILEILEYVCEKQNLDSKQYELFRNNKPVDLSLTVRFANIPNNGQLELIKASIARTEQKVTIAMDLEDGSRQIKEFEANHSLWHIIHVMFENNPILKLEENNEFCVIYMRKEISGETQLKQTNLKSLGLAQGKAALKLLVRPANAAKEQAYVESLILKKTSIESETEKQKVSQNSGNDSQKILSKIEPKIEEKVNENQRTFPKDLSENNETNVEMETIDEKSVKQPKATELQQIDVQSMDTQSDVESEQSSDETEEVLNFLGTNNSEILFKMSDLPKLTQIEYPDQFYETTKDDLVCVLKDLQKQQVSESLKPLRLEQMQRYKSTVIRICLPNDKLVFQAVFKPTDKIENVIQVLKPYVSATDFYLFTVPPKRILKPELSLFESDLVPAAVLHFGNKSADSQTVIKEEFKSRLSSYKSAAKIAANKRNDGKQSDVGTSDQSLTTTQTDRRVIDTNSDEKVAKMAKLFKINH